MHFPVIPLFLNFQSLQITFFSNFFKFYGLSIVDIFTEKLHTQHQRAINRGASNGFMCLG